ncbi:MAG: peptidoglycan editing factor PgeF [Proteobacteria bacterium]|nr:peptidoglycan editing factor PgeF [Pseudomonadota bacterium]NBP13937.1 peptidoglycan editing factor PgeF [bacterium]
METIFWGDRTSAIDPETLGDVTAETVLMQEPYKTLQERLGFKACVMMHQVHGTNGYCIKPLTDLSQLLLRSQEADFLVTDCKQVALAVLTADCLPIVFIDKKKQVIAIAHAGWKGTVNKIAQKTVMAMSDQFGSELSNIKVFFGPSALVCCYEVQQPFSLALAQDPFAQKSLIERNHKIYFDVTYYNQLTLQAMGISPEVFNFQAQRCTICTPGYCSYRGQNGTQLRNITSVSLK